MNRLPFALLMTTVLLLVACGQNSRTGMPPLETVSQKVDLNRYLGKWYEIARYDNAFQKDCVASMATYSMRPDGNISVLNQCRVSTLEGELKSVEGKAWVVDPATNAKLKVSFFWPFSGDYWIIELGEHYEYAVVGHPNRKYLWILSRTPQMNDARYNEILNRLASTHCYDTTRLVKTPQPSHLQSSKDD